MGDEITLLRQQLQQSQAEILALKHHNVQLLRTQSHVPVSSQLANAIHQNQRVNPLARSQSTVGYGQDYATQSPKGVARLNRLYSNQSPASMSRTASARFESMPFRQTGPISPLESQPLYRSTSDQSRMNHRSSSQQSLANIQENDVLPGVGVNPAEFIASYSEDEGTYLATTRPLAPTDIQFFQNASQCPSMYSGVTAHDAASPMTRQNSTFENGQNWGVDMVNTVSSQSMFATGSEHMLFPNMGFSQSSDGSPKHHPAANQDLLGLGANLQDASPLSSYAPASFDTSLTGDLSADLSAEMERTSSNESASSTRSISSNLERRAKERHRQVLENSKRGIVPKPQQSDASPPVIKKKNKVAPNKLGYQRRKQPRVFCSQCSEHPGGFRGDHELQRHINAKHAIEVTKFVCRDPASAGRESKVQPKVPLKGCKSCDGGKLYGAYYNAAAHLRRAHFVPKLSRGKTKSAEEKRGGKAGGNWPPMDDLKLWYEKITVISGGAAVSPSDEAESPEDEVDDMDIEAEDFESEPVTGVQNQPSGLDSVAAAMSGATAEWAGIVQPEISLPEPQAYMAFPGQISLENSPANLSYSEDNSPPTWETTAPSSYASPALGFLSQESPAVAFPAF
ncbi:unnamed protein product [Clonostachys rosea]|uniref:DUF7896 domain-containing protein n=1 Tax=Bionectria ochroleuca TaxID=29856 RepID=A0ABY6UGT2_BIOOC|nr:unnamed protein product [Clonostachys rosea]